MRIALLSDIHGNLPALQAVVADIQKHAVDLIVNLGDSLSGPLLPKETAQYLMQRSWIHLAGNHERQLLSSNPERLGPSDAYALSQLGPIELDWLRSLPATARPQHDVLLCHGTPTSDITYFLETVQGSTAELASATEIAQRMGTESAALIACGHTHIPRVVRTENNQLIVNPGSVGLPAYTDHHPTAHAMQTGSPDARFAIAQFTNQGWTATLHSIPYNHLTMAELADLRGRPDWAHALRTGYAAL